MMKVKAHTLLAATPPSSIDLTPGDPLINVQAMLAASRESFTYKIVNS